MILFLFYVMSKKRVKKGTPSIAFSRLQTFAFSYSLPVGEQLGPEFVLREQQGGLSWCPEGQYSGQDPTGEDALGGRPEPEQEEEGVDGCMNQGGM